jgi:hypothetical protein
LPRLQAGRQSLVRFRAAASRSFSSFGLLLCLTIVSFAQQVSTGAAGAHERTLFVESFTAEKLWKWQQRLNLQSWNITVATARANELKAKTMGSIHWDPDNKTAVIQVLDPTDYTLPFEAMLQDLEFTIVHELVHLELSPAMPSLPRTEENRRDEEHAVNYMAQALIDLDHAR